MWKMILPVGACAPWQNHTDKVLRTMLFVLKNILPLCWSSWSFSSIRLFHSRVFMFSFNHYFICWQVVCLPILSNVNCPTCPSLLLFIGSLYNWMSLEPNNKKIEYSSVLYLVLILSYHNWIESWEALSVHSVCIYFPSLNIFQLPFVEPSCT